MLSHPRLVAIQRLNASNFQLSCCSPYFSSFESWPLKGNGYGKNLNVCGAHRLVGGRVCGSRTFRNWATVFLPREIMINCATPTPDVKEVWIQKSVAPSRYGYGNFPSGYLPKHETSLMINEVVLI